MIVPKNDDEKQHPISTDEIKSRMTVLDLAQADGLKIKKSGSSWWCCCPIHGEKTPSFQIFPGDRGFFCRGCGAGGDVFNYLQLTRGFGFREALDYLAGRAGSLPSTKRSIPTKQPDDPPAYLPVPVPASAPPPFTTHYQLGQAIDRWTYHDTAGSVLAHVLRFHERDDQGNPVTDPLTGKPKKTDRPLTWGIGRHGSYCWNWKGWPSPKPLYNLHLLAANPTAPIIITEGEKDADGAAALFPERIATCSMNGAASPHLTDWTPLRGRDVWILPDADEPGAAYAAVVVRLAEEAGAAFVQVVEFTP